MSYFRIDELQGAWAVVDAMLANQVCICANSEVSYLGDVPHTPPFYAKPGGEETENKNKGGRGWGTSYDK